MKLTRAPRTLGHPRTVVRAATGPMDEEKLGQTMSLTQVVLLALSAARVRADAIRGPLSIEGVIALALAFALAMSLFDKAIGWTIGGASTKSRHSDHLRGSPHR